MKKTSIRIFAVTLILFLTKVGFSQAPTPVRLGLRIAPCISWMSPNEKGYEYKGVTAGFSFGFISEFNFTQHYAITSGFNFSFMGGNLQLPYAKAPDTGTLNRKYSFRYLEVPLMIKMKTREFGHLTYFGQIGFGTGFNLRTKVKDDFTTLEKGTISDKSNLSTSEVCFIREAVLAGLGVEYKIDESVSLILGLSYSNSLNNVLLGKNTKDPGLDNRSSLNYIELNIGVLF
jgi:opacity protein-like surface antigen